jgi:3-oxoadipate enol-lactonase
MACHAAVRIEKPAWPSENATSAPSLCLTHGKAVFKQRFKFPGRRSLEKDMQTSHSTTRGIHWIEQSPGAKAPAVVLLHGLGSDAKFWLAEQAVLAKDFRVLAIDLRGSGQSIGSHLPFAIGTLVEDVIDVLDEARLASAHIVGFSMGGVVAQALALTAPERVTSLVLAATFAKVNRQARLFLQALGSLYRSGATPMQMYDLIVPWLFSMRFLSEARADSYTVYVEDPSDKQSPQDWLHLLGALLDYDGYARLNAIRSPTLVICGDEDRLAPHSDAKKLAAGIRGAVLEVVPGGHLMNIESPAAFIGHILWFLMGNSVQPSVRMDCPMLSA